MKIDGSCHCGKITFNAELDPDKVVICHCTDCQSLSASAFRTVGVVNAEDFKLGTNKPKIYVKIAESGAKRAQAFCPDCGSAIYASSFGEGEPLVYNIRLGTVRQRDQLLPKKQIWNNSALGWLSTLGDIPKAEIK